ncbi:MAG: excinuclease ABC subunit UvrA [Gemmataceae bacterium]
MTNPDEWIVVRGARVHNLDNIDVHIPHNQMTVITGPSGSGKSSLAFDTINAEGQRRYLETLRVDSTALFDQLHRPDVDLVDGLPPTLCVSQNISTPHPRSTLATVTEIHDHLRLLWARVGTPHCYQCGSLISRQTQSEIVQRVMDLPEGQRLLILAPMVKQQKGKHEDAFKRIRQAGLLRARIDGRVEEVEETPTLSPHEEHTIEMVVDRLVVRPRMETRLRESLKTAIEHSGGPVIVVVLRGQEMQDMDFTTRYACTDCDIEYGELEPRNFHFNSPHGACPVCRGLGDIVQIDPSRLVPDRRKSLKEVIADLKGLLPSNVKLPAISKKTLDQWQETLALKDTKLTASMPLESWPDDALTTLLFGGQEGTHSFRGLVPLLQETLEAQNDETESEIDWQSLTSWLPCPECRGARLNAEARSVVYTGKTLPEVTTMTVQEAEAFFAERLSTNHNDIVSQPEAMILPDIHKRLRFLNKVGLGYLTLARPAVTLSGGELQRARLATQLGTGLVGVCYILDEPTIGLHPRDTDKLLASLRSLQNQGNTLLVVEHDEMVTRAADYLIEIGPGPGPAGGKVVVAGPRMETIAKVLPTQKLVVRQQLPVDNKGPHLILRGVSHRNLKDIDVAIPLGRLVCITGVSGSGKSSLIYEVLCRIVRRHLRLSTPEPGTHGSCEGLDHIDKLIEVDQSPIGRSRRSCPATYTGLFDEVRRIYATTRESKIRGYKATRFSMNTKGGRCEACRGQGVLKVSLKLLPGLTVVCPTCRGKRFDAATLEIRYKGCSISDVLEMRIDQAAKHLENVPKAARMLQALVDVGVGYLALGQPANSLSGGEAQRVKLAAEMGRTTTGKTLLVLDEPTTGLHYTDVSRLIEVLHKLVQAGNTVIVIEHNLDMLANADWVIDLGPGAGPDGGAVVVSGSPKVVAAHAESVTGGFLAKSLSRFE